MNQYADAQDRYRDKVAFVERDLSLPVVIVTSTLVASSFEYHFAPSPLVYRWIPPDAQRATLQTLETPRARRLIERIDTWTRVLEESDLIYRGDPVEALGSSAGYVFAFDLAPEDLAEVESSPRLKLVHVSASGNGRWYESR